MKSTEPISLKTFQYDVIRTRNDESNLRAISLALLIKFLINERFHSITCAGGEPSRFFLCAYYPRRPMWITFGRYIVQQP